MKKEGARQGTRRFSKGREHMRAATPEKQKREELPMPELQIGGAKVTVSIPMAKRKQFWDAVLALGRKANAEHGDNPFGINASSLIVDIVIQQGEALKQGGSPSQDGVTAE